MADEAEIEEGAMTRIELERLVLSGKTAKASGCKHGANQGRVGCVKGRALRTMSARVVSNGRLYVSPSATGAETIHAKRVESNSLHLQGDNSGAGKVRVALLNVSRRNPFGFVRWLIRAQSLAACVIAAILTGCGNGGRPAFAGNYVTVRLYVVIDPAAITPDEARTAWTYAQERFDRAGIAVRAVSLEGVIMPEGDWRYLLKDQYRRLWEAQKYLRRNGLDTPWELHYFFYPPIIDGGKKLFGGLAQGVCDFARGGVAIGQAGAWSSHTPPLPRLDASGMIADHECGHLLGCEHYDDQPNIMHYAAGMYIDGDPLWFLPVSIEQMKWCMGVSKTRSIKQCRNQFRGEPFKRRRCVQYVKGRAPRIRSRQGDFYFE